MRELTGNEIRSIRNGVGMTQRQFADTYCISLRTFQKWEQGERKPESSGLLLLHMIRADHEVTARIVRAARETERA
jgi:putative transcriptional regulator